MPIQNLPNIKELVRIFEAETISIIVKYLPTVERC